MTCAALDHSRSLVGQAKSGECPRRLNMQGVSHSNSITSMKAILAARAYYHQPVRRPLAESSSY